MYALAILGCLLAIMLVPVALLVLGLALGALHVILLYFVLPFLILRFLWDLFTNPRSSFANLVANVRTWGIARRSAASRFSRLRSRLSFSWMADLFRGRKSKKENQEDIIIDHE